MSDARSRILGKVRAAMGRETAPTPADVKAARAGALGHGTPQRPVWDESDLERFCRCIEDAAGTWVSVPTVADAGPAIADYLVERNAGETVHRAPDPRLDQVAWPDHLTVEHATDGRQALAGVSCAVAGVAETGSLALVSGPDNPATLAFLPDYHIVVLDTADVVPWFEDLWERMRQQDGFPPRSFNFITGPSRTADVEQTLQLGAHGPRSLHVILVESTP